MWGGRTSVVGFWWNYKVWQPLIRLHWVSAGGWVASSFCFFCRSCIPRYEAFLICSCSWVLKALLSNLQQQNTISHLVMLVCCWCILWRGFELVALVGFEALLTALLLLSSILYCYHTWALEIADRKVLLGGREGGFYTSMVISWSSFESDIIARIRT